uniref:Uncharacterized protein n=1 Tax=Glossina austeni TaxID=7395 RepID=A0A1A9V9G2_GLOAU
MYLCLHARLKGGLLNINFDQLCLKDALQQEPLHFIGTRRNDFPDKYGILSQSNPQDSNVNNTPYSNITQNKINDLYFNFISLCLSISPTVGFGIFALCGIQQVLASLTNSSNTQGIAADIAAPSGDATVDLS